MSLFRKSAKTEDSKSSRVVVTGKRLKGSWIMESTLEPKARRSAHDPSVLVAENRRVRTLH
ncbi:MAG: hypothetical protein ACI8TX_000567 [Hyphomicrobiaceae bacterium]|jgi:hypothetical protein